MSGGGGAVTGQERQQQTEARDAELVAAWKHEREETRAGAHPDDLIEIGDALAARLSGLQDTLAAKNEALRGVSNAYGCFAGCTGGLPGAPADGSGHTPACDAARAALALGAGGEATEPNDDTAEARDGE